MLKDSMLLAVSDTGLIGETLFYYGLLALLQGLSPITRQRHTFYPIIASFLPHTYSILAAASILTQSRDDDTSIVRFRNSASQNRAVRSICSPETKQQSGNRQGDTEEDGSRDKSTKLRN